MLRYYNLVCSAKRADVRKHSNDARCRKEPQAHREDDNDVEDELDVCIHWDDAVHEVKKHSDDDEGNDDSEHEISRQLSWLGTPWFLHRITLESRVGSVWLVSPCQGRIDFLFGKPLFGELVLFPAVIRLENNEPNQERSDDEYRGMYV